MPLRNHDKLEALAQRYGWHIIGWSVDLHNPAGISLVSNYDGNRFLRFQHSDSLTKWRLVLEEESNAKPKKSKPQAATLTFDDVQAENKRLKAELTALKRKRRVGK